MIISNILNLIIYIYISVGLLIVVSFAISPPHNYMSRVNKMLRLHRRRVNHWRTVHYLKSRKNRIAAYCNYLHSKLFFLERTVRYFSLLFLKFSFSFVFVWCVIEVQFYVEDINNKHVIPGFFVKKQNINPNM